MENDSDSTSLNHQLSSSDSEADGKAESTSLIVRVFTSLFVQACIGTAATALVKYNPSVYVHICESKPFEVTLYTFVVVNLFLMRIPDAYQFGVGHPAFFVQWVVVQAFFFAIVECYAFGAVWWIEICAAGTMMWGLLALTTAISRNWDHNRAKVLNLVLSPTLCAVLHSLNWRQWSEDSGGFLVAALGTVFGVAVGSATTTHVLSTMAARELQVAMHCLYLDFYGVLLVEWLFRWLWSIVRCQAACVPYYPPHYPQCLRATQVQEKCRVDDEKM